ncbi:MAG: rhodanese-like domain-containing protein [Gammaproteobacteria bacterium]|jgi:rhodanese-related sulfurtransferase|nr:rhodanese-like domain-containing protein [Gammaproteobacteria bacterium]
MHLLTGILTLSFASGLLSVGVAAEQKAAGLTVKITPELDSVKVDGGVIVREQDTKHTVDPAFAKTSRPCPPFCIQPMTLAPGVETIGELELIDYVRRRSEGEEDILIVDSRTPDWVARGTIPGAVNIPWTKLSPSQGASPFEIEAILSDTFNVQESEGLWDFRDAKTLVLFCNGMWCGQSPTNIRSLLRFGYPAHKIKWYRGGMQAWEILGFSKSEPH